MNDPIPWSTFFMGVADLAAQRSKDPRTQVGACIVDARKRIIATGYNGMPNCDNNDECFPWTHDAPHCTDTKYPYVVHAEVNALVNAVADVRGASMYVTKFPCNECAKLICQMGIERVVFKGAINLAPNSSYCHIASVRMFEHCGVEYTSYQ